jgi:hypothetical protein
MRDGCYKVNQDGEAEAVDNVVITLARERLRGAQWDLERTCRRIYGANVDITSKNNEIPGERDIASIARSVAFLMRKGEEQERVSERVSSDIEDAKLVDNQEDSA